jgi:hypothetical protein
MRGKKKLTQSQAEGAKAKDLSWNFYYCPYILKTKEVCNQKCYDLKGCKAHRNSRQVLCKEKKCDENTRSKYDYCDTHAKNIDQRNIIIGKSLQNSRIYPSKLF